VCSSAQLDEVTTLRDPDSMKRLEQLVNERQNQGDGG
jgi:hypothetical protein